MTLSAEKINIEIYSKKAVKRREFYSNGYLFPTSISAFMTGSEIKKIYRRK